ncbi:PBP1A family penicillin-binding protein [bacterium]|nr:PBP1A family penicillin-binding protein [candidate division CSSED10-310 bacterium]
MKYARWKPVIVIFSLLGLLTGVTGGFVIGIMSRHLPPVDSLTRYKPAVQTTVYDSGGELIGRYYEERRIVLQRREIPSHVIDALIAAEDREFYRHGGFDMPGILRASLLNIKTRKISQGGSTITQQVARLMFLSNERTFTRKIKEAIQTAKIERRFSKEEIIAIYLNHVCFGHGAFGIEAAARTFFNKHATELTVPESALLVSVLKNPTYFSPVKYPDRARTSRNRVLLRMRDAQFIDDLKYQQYITEPIGLNLEVQEGFIAPYFVEEIRKELVQAFSLETVVSGGLNVRSTLDRRHQDGANRAVQAGLEAFRQRHPEAQDIQAALVSMRPITGEITAMVGGSSFQKTKFNRAVQGRRQSGSVIKPFVYLAALQAGFNGSTILMDTEYEYRDPQTKVVWRPRNYDQKYRGPVTLRVCLEDSLNVPTAKLLEKVGIEPFLDIAHRAGIESKLPPYPSTALGAGEVTLLELTNAFATVAGGGLRTCPRMIHFVTDSEGKEMYHPESDVKEVFDAVSCYQLTRILEGVVEHGTGWRAKVLNRPVAAKTGTTDDYTNAWFVGYIPDLVVGVWVGFDMNAGMGSGETGSKAAGPIFVDFMQDVLTDVPSQPFPVPKGIHRIPVCHESGYLASSHCPVVVEEVFPEGQTPRLHCPIHPQ